MKHVSIFLFGLALTGCTTIESLVKGDFDTREECLQTLNEEIADMDLSEDLADKIRARFASRCDGVENFRDLANVRDAIEAEVKPE